MNVDRFFLVIVKKNLETHEVNNLGASLKSYLKLDKNIQIKIKQNKIYLNCVQLRKSLYSI